VVGILKLVSGEDGAGTIDHDDPDPHKGESHKQQDIVELASGFHDQPNSDFRF
jgi:hypothetical protein